MSFRQNRYSAGFHTAFSRHGRDETTFPPDHWLARLSPAGWYKVKYTLCNKDKLVNSIKLERAPTGQ